jgi:hypothetical protein
LRCLEAENGKIKSVAEDLESGNLEGGSSKEMLLSMAGPNYGSSIRLAEKNASVLTVMFELAVSVPAP